MQASNEQTDTDRAGAAVDDQTALDRDEVFRLLQVERRRRVVRHLLAFVGEPVPLDALATAVARAEHDDPERGLDPEVRERVAISLDHGHLPKLEAAGIVAYDRTRDRVTATEAIEQLEPFVDPPAESTSSGRTTRNAAVAGVAGGSLATLLALRRWRAASVGAAAVLVLSLLWTAGRRGRPGPK